MSRRSFVIGVALAATLTGGSVMAQSWPSKPIRRIVPFPAGGTPDMLVVNAGTPVKTVAEWVAMPKAQRASTATAPTTATAPRST